MCRKTCVLSSSSSSSFWLAGPIRTHFIRAALAPLWRRPLIEPRRRPTTLSNIITLRVIGVGSAKHTSIPIDHISPSRCDPLGTLSNITRSQGHEMTSFYTDRLSQFDNLHAAIAAAAPSYNTPISNVITQETSTTAFKTFSVVSFIVWCSVTVIPAATHGRPTIMNLCRDFAQWNVTQVHNSSCRPILISAECFANVLSITCNNDLTNIDGYNWLFKDMPIPIVQGKRRSDA